MTGKRERESESEMFMGLCVIPRITSALSEMSCLAIDECFNVKYKLNFLSSGYNAITVRSVC